MSLSFTTGKTFTAGESGIDETDMNNIVNALTYSGSLEATKGGTAQTTWTQGDLLYSSASNTLSKLGAGTKNQVLVTGGSSANPAWASTITETTARNVLTLAHTTTDLGANNLFSVTSSAANTGSALAYIGNTNTSAVNEGLLIDSHSIGAALSLDVDANSASSGFVLKITGTNAGAGGIDGIDLSDTNLTTTIKFPTDATDPTSGGGAATGRIAINIGGAVKYLAYY